MARTRVGLDLGSTSVRAAEVSLGSDPPAVVRAAQVPVPAGAVVGGEVQSPAQVADALRELWRRGGFKNKQVTTGVGNQRVVVREIVVPSLPERELRQSLPFQVQEMIPIPVDQAILDFDVLEELEQEGRKMARILVAAAQRHMVDQHVEAILAARLEPVGVDLIPFALVRAVGTTDGMGLDSTEAGGEAVVDVGADVTNICVHERGVPRFVRILPSGGGDITSAVATALSITDEQAESLKRGVESEGAPPPAEAEEVVRKRAAALADEIRSSLDFYRTQSPGAQVTRILVTGGGSKVAGLEDLMTRRIGIATERGHPFAKVNLQVNLTEEERAEAEPLLAVAIGLAIPQEAGP